MPYNKILTNLAFSSRTGDYWPLVVFVRTLLRTVTTSDQYSPVRPSCLVFNGYYLSDMSIYTYIFLFLPNWGSRYGPPVRTKYRVIVENMSSRTSWQVCVRLQSCGLNVMLKGLIQSFQCSACNDYCQYYD